MIKQQIIKTKPFEMYDVTPDIQAAVRESGVQQGLCVVFCPHAGAGLLTLKRGNTDIETDVLEDLHRLFPPRLDVAFFDPIKAAAYLKSGITGVTKDIAVEDGKPVLADGVGVFLAEYEREGERSLKIQVLGT